MKKNTSLMVRVQSRLGGSFVKTTHERTMWSLVKRYHLIWSIQVHQYQYPCVCVCVYTRLHIFQKYEHIVNNQRPGWDGCIHNNSVVLTFGMVTWYSTIFWYASSMASTSIYENVNPEPKVEHQVGCKRSVRSETWDVYFRMPSILDNDYTGTRF